MIDTLFGLLAPFVGTAAGAVCVLFARRERENAGALQGFAAGIMTAATVWSLLLPALERSAALGALAFLPAAAGLWLGIGFLAGLDRLLLRLGGEETSAPASLLVLAVTLHNIPEGMAVGAVYAALRAGAEGVTAGGAFALALGIALQNIPEGAIVSLPVRARGRSRRFALAAGVLSGAVEPVFGALTVLAASHLVPALPVVLGFAAGAMLWVVARELLPASVAAHSARGTLAFAAGFTLMMALDVALG